MKNKEQYEIMNDIFNIFIVDELRNVFSKDSLESMYKDYMINAKKIDTSIKDKYNPTNYTSENHVNFVKYSKNNPPPNTRLSMTPGTKDDSLIGVFELNSDNYITLNEICKKIINLKSKNTFDKLD